MADRSTPVEEVDAFISHERGRESHSVAAELEGALLASSSTFPYFMLVAFEAGGPLRALFLLLISPFLRFLQYHTSLQVMIFVATAGLRLSDIKAVAKASLCRFYLADLGEEAYRVLSSCGGKKHVVTHIPRFMVEPFLRDYLEVDCVIGAELRTTSHGYCLGLVQKVSPVVDGGAGVRSFESAGVVVPKEIDVGLMAGAGAAAGGGCDGLKKHPFMSLCREKYEVLGTRSKQPSVLPASCYPKPLIFHDGRLVSKPTPADALAVLLWMPFAFLLAILRIMVGALLPYRLGLLGAAATGFRIRADDVPPSTSKEEDEHIIGREKTEKAKGTLYVCSHRTLLDPVIVSSALQRRVTAVTYSVSRVSELLSPIPTFRLTRDRSRDGEIMRGLLEKGDLVVCPEGTTCREPYLLRFSPLFVEVAEDVDMVPVAITAEGSMFYGSTVRGHKWLDSFFFLMNPTPCYRLLFLHRQYRQLLLQMDRKSSIDAANQVQRLVADALGFQSTNFTRRDKYRMIAGNDGVVVEVDQRRTVGPIG